MNQTGELSGIIAIIRLRRQLAADEILHSLTNGGVGTVEVTLGTPGCLQTVSQWRCTGGAYVGVGSVRTESDAMQAIDAGAQFLVTPTTMLPVLQAAERAEIPVVCGALTPTEIDTAWQHGAAAVKIFPVDALGGHNYIKSLQGPMPDVPLLPTGGVDPEASKRYAETGCSGVGVGSALVGEDIVAARDWASLTKRAALFVEAWQDGTHIRNGSIS